MGGLIFVERAAPGTAIAPHEAPAADFRPLRVPTGPDSAATLPGLPFWRRTHARRLSTPRDGHAWRSLPGDSNAGDLFSSASRTESPQRRFCSESHAQELTLRPLGPGLPHQRRHPMTPDEALAGLVLAIVCLSALVYLAARCF